MSVLWLLVGLFAWIAVDLILALIIGRAARLGEWTEEGSADIGGDSPLLLESCAPVQAPSPLHTTSQGRLPLGIETMRCKDQNRP